MQRKLRSIPRSLHKSKRAAQSKIFSRLKWITFLLILSIGMFYLNNSFTTLMRLNLTGESPNLPTTDLSRWRDNFEKIMLRLYVPTQWVSGLNQFQGFSNPEVREISITISFPKEFSIEKLIFSLLQNSKQNHVQLVESYEKLLPCQFGISLACPNGKLIQINFKEDLNLAWYSGKIAVVIDDFGYKIDKSVQSFLSLPFPVTFAVIPGTKFAKQVANKAYRAKSDVLIHLPMEPLKSPVEDDGFTVFTNMSEKQLEEVISKSIAAVPHAIGVNNHMGSKATMDKKTMARLMRIIKRHNLYFLDSVTNRQSIAYSFAIQTGVLALKMTTYIDNIYSSISVEQKLESVVKNLKNTKTAIVIGHDNQKTAKILAKEMIRWRYLGVKFVRLSELFDQKKM